MRKHKQKWTVEEVEALKAGVAKYGTGTWKNILGDPEFKAKLANRSNVDLKDRWRNMRATANHEQGCKENSTIPKGKATASRAMSPKTRNNSSVSTLRDKTNENPPRSLQEVKNKPIYNEMIFEAISSVKDPSGTDTGAIMGFIEQKYEVPRNFRRLLTSQLRRLVSQGKLDKVKNGYKIKDTALGTKTPSPKQKDLRPRPLATKTPTPKQKDLNWATFNVTMMMEDAARKTAHEIAEAEYKAFLTVEAVEQSEWVSQMAEETEAMLTLCKEFLENYTSDG